MKTYFYRHEFMYKGTLHTHALVWLNNLTEIDVKRITAHLPTDDPDYSFQVLLRVSTINITVYAVVYVFITMIC